MLKHLTPPRLATVRAFFQATSDADLLGCYAWNQAVGSGLLPILGDFEVPLRNALHTSLSQYYGGVDSYDWMMPRPNPAHAANAAAPAFLPAMHRLPQRSADDIKSVIDKIKGKKAAGYVVTPDDIVGALPFGFWEVLIGGLGHAAHPVGLQAAILAKVFPHAPDTATVPYGDARFRKRVVELLKRIRDTRNRIGHHDSLWSVPEFNQHGGLGFIPRRPRHTVISLRKFADCVCWFSGWIGPDIPAYIRSSDHWWSFQALLSRRALATYRRMGGRVGTYQKILNETNGTHTGRIQAPRLRIKVMKERALELSYHY